MFCVTGSSLDIISLPSFGFRRRRLKNSMVASGGLRGLSFLGGSVCLQHIPVPFSAVSIVVLMASLTSWSYFLVSISCRRHVPAFLHFRSWLRGLHRSLCTRVAWCCRTPSSVCDLCVCLHSIFMCM